MHYKKTEAEEKTGFKWPSKDWLVSANILDFTVSTILDHITLNRHHDIPYLAGYSQDGKTIYIDKHMPTSFIFNDQIINTDKFLILHEVVEKSLIDQLGLQYQLAHQIALRTEQAAVRAEGISWKAYDQFMQKYIKNIGDENLKSVPQDLDFKPYQDEHDDNLLLRMQNTIHKKK